MSWLDFSWLDLSWLEPHDLTWPDLIFPGLAWPDLTCPELTFPNLLGLINLSNLTYTEWTCPDFIWPVLTCPDLTWYVLKLPVLTWSVLIWPRKIQVKLNSQAGPECGKMFRTQTIQALDTIHTPKIHSRQLPTTIGKYIQNVKLYPGWWVGGWLQVHNHATSWSNLQDCKISSRAEIPKLDRVWQYWHIMNFYLLDNVPHYKTPSP